MSGEMRRNCFLVVLSFLLLCAACSCSSDAEEPAQERILKAFAVTENAPTLQQVSYLGCAFGESAHVSGIQITEDSLYFSADPNRLFDFCKVMQNLDCASVTDNFFDLPYRNKWSCQ